MVDPDEVRTIFMVLFMVFEPMRLLAGYYGNLREEVCTREASSEVFVYAVGDYLFSAGTSIACFDYAEHHSDLASMHLHACCSISHGLISNGSSVTAAGISAI